MPRTIDIEGDKRSVATEAELLDFANSIREAGGANVLEALLPSEPSNSTACLIANALNFGCSVQPSPYSSKLFADGSERWVMELPENLTADQRAALAAVKGVRLCRWVDEFDSRCEAYYLTLPKHIGNAALAFDTGDAFQKYARAS